MSRLIPLLMPEPASTGALRSERGLDRLAAFSDAVVAIAITLVVLPLVDLAGERTATVTGLLHDDGYRLGAAGVSFLVIGSLWRQHHTEFERAVRDSRRLVALNLMWLAAIALLPVPTALLFAPEAPKAATHLAVAVYALTAAFAMAVMCCMEIEIRLHCGDGRAPRPPLLAALAPWLPAVLMLAAGVLALTGLGTRALLVLLLALPVGWVSGAVRRFHAGRHPVS